MGCSESGLVDRAVHVGTGEGVDLAQAHRSPALAPGQLWAAGFDGGIWDLPEAYPERVAPLVPHEPLAAAFDGGHLVLLWEDGIELVEVGDKERRRFPAAPERAEVALVWPWAAWVEGGIRRVSVEGAPGETVEGTRVAGGPRFVWTGRDSVCSPECVPADSGFLSPPTAGEDQVCWEDRGDLRTGGEVQVRCLDRVVGGVTHPSVYAGWLLVRSEGGVWVTP